MNTANDRFKEVRIELKKTQSEFGEIIGITREGIASIEAGRRNVTDKHLKSLEMYREKPINTEWIRTGEGSMFKKRTRNQEIQAYANTLMEDVDESFKKRFFLALSKLDDSQWELLEQIIDNLKKD